MWLWKDAGVVSGIITSMKEHKLSWKNPNNHVQIVPHPMNCRTKIQILHLYHDGDCFQMGPTVCPASEVFLSLDHILYFQFESYNLVSPLNSAEVYDVDFGFPTDHTLRGCQNTPCTMGKNISRLLDNVPFVGREHFHCSVGFEESLGFLGRFHLSCKGIKEEFLHIIVDEYVQDRPLTPVEGQTMLSLMKGTKSHSPVVLIFEGCKISRTNGFWVSVVPLEALYFVSHFISIQIFHGWHYIWRLKRKMRLEGYLWS